MSATYLLVSQTGNIQGPASASNLLMSQGAVASKDTQDSFDIADIRMKQFLEDVLNDNTVNLDETFLYSVDDKINDAESSLFVAQGQRRARRQPAYLDDFVG